MSDPNTASLLCLSPSDAVGGEANNEHKYTVHTVCKVKDDILTNDGATLCTVNILCADFHPTVEIHLSETLHN